MRTPGGSVEVDTSGRSAGRGAYICGVRDCWEAALKGDRIGRALRTTVSANDRDALRSYAEQVEAR